MISDLLKNLLISFKTYEFSFFCLIAQSVDDPFSIAWIYPPRQVKVVWNGNDLIFVMDLRTNLFYAFYIVIFVAE